MGEDEPELRRDLMTAKTPSTQDGRDPGRTRISLVRLGRRARCGDAAAQTQARDAMLALLNKRSYLCNLVRDVNEVLE